MKKSAGSCNAGSIVADPMIGQRPELIAEFITQILNATGDPMIASTGGGEL